MRSGRVQNRADVELDVGFEEGGVQVFGSAVNLSPSGVLLRSDRPPSVGSRVHVVISLPPTGVFLRLQGEVVRHAAESARPAFAIRFRAVDERARAELGRFVRTANA